MRSHPESLPLFLLLWSVALVVFADSMLLILCLNTYVTIVQFQLLLQQRLHKRSIEAYSLY